MKFWEVKSFKQSQHTWAKDQTRAETLMRLFILNKRFILSLFLDIIFLDQIES